MFITILCDCTDLNFVTCRALFHESNIRLYKTLQDKHYD